MSTLDQVADRATLIIAHVLPDREPDTRFYEAPGEGPLSELPPGDPGDATRGFHVLCAGQGGPAFGEWMGTLVQGQAGLLVEVRYVCPARHGGYLRADRLAAADAMRLAHELAVEPTLEGGWGETLCPIIDPAGSSFTRFAPDFYLLRLAFAVQLDVEKNQ